VPNSVTGTPDSISLIFEVCPACLRQNMPRRAAPDHVLPVQLPPGVDGTLIKATTWSWGAYVDRLEGGWLTSPAAKGVNGGTPAEWAEETHRAARSVWEQLPANRVVDDGYYAKILATLDRQIGLGGLRLARFLNDMQAPGQCVRS